MIGDEIMRKKKDQVVIKDEELTPTVLFTIKEKKGGLLWVALLFALFIGLVYFLPDLSDMYQQYKNKNKPSLPLVNQSGDNTPDEEEQVEVEERVKYPYAADLKIETDDFVMDSFNLANNTLTFSLTNKKDSVVDLRNQNYFLSIYQSEGKGDSLVKRLKIAEDSFDLNETKSYSYPVNSTSISYFYLDKLEESAYPEFTLTKTEDGIATLTCTKDNSTLTYTFNNDNLNTIREIVRGDINATNYQSDLASFQTKSTNYNLVNGVSSTFSSSDTGFIYSVTIDLTKANIRSLDDIRFYSQDTKANVVKFEMEGRNYTCS